MGWKMRLRANNPKKWFPDLILYITVLRGKCVGYRGHPHRKAIISASRRSDLSHRDTSSYEHALSLTWM